MPKRRQRFAFEDIFAREKARILEQEGKARAGLEGRPPMSQRPTRVLEDEAWTGRDPNVTPEHLAQIAQQTVEELMADKDPTGRPRWSFEDIENEARYRQTMAVYPWRHKTYLTGYAEDDFEAHEREARRIAQRHQQQFTPSVAEALDTGGWTEVEEDDVAAVAMGQSAPATVPEQTAPQVQAEMG